MHDFGNRVHNLVVAAAAARRAMGNLLNLAEHLLQIIEGRRFVHRILDVKIGDLLALANYTVFHSDSFLTMRS